MLTSINCVSDQVSLSHIPRATAEYILVFINGHCQFLTFTSGDILRYPLHEGLEVLCEILGIHVRVISGVRCLSGCSFALDASGTDIRQLIIV